MRPSSKELGLLQENQNPILTSGAKAASSTIGCSWYITKLFSTEAPNIAKPACKCNVQIYIETHRYTQGFKKQKNSNPPSPHSSLQTKPKISSKHLQILF